MLTLAQATYNFNKYSQSCWILMKMIETSPFVFNMIYKFMLLDSFTFSGMSDLSDMLLDAPEFEGYKISDISLGALFKIVRSPGSIFLFGTGKEEPKVKKNYNKNN